MTVHLNSGLQYFEFAGAQFALDYQCASENPTHLLVLVNGYQRTRLDFRAFRKKLEKLCPHVATVAFDNRYCGETKVTERDAEFSIDVMAKDTFVIAEAFMHKLNLKSFSLLGISMGGMIVQSLAGSLPYSIVENLFLVSTTCGGQGRTWSRPVTDPSQLKYENKNINFELTKKNMSRYFANKFLNNSPLLFEMMCKNIIKNSNKKEEEHFANMQFNVSVKFDGVHFLNKINAKQTVIFSGDEDKIIPIENAHYLNSHISNSKLVIYQQVGHLILIEEPELFVQDTSCFFL